MKRDTPVILPRSVELEQLAESLLAQLDKAIPLDRAAFCRVSAPGEIELLAISPATGGGPPAGLKLPFEAVLGAEAVRAGLAIEVDLAESPLPFDRQLVAAGYRRALRLPVRGDGVAVAALALVRRTERFTESQIACAIDIVGRASPAILAMRARERAS